jgi:hypothetical protein
MALMSTCYKNLRNQNIKTKNKSEKNKVIMFSFAKHSKMDRRGYVDSKLLSILPETNTHQNLEFRLPPQKRYLKLCDTSLSFSIELPNNYAPRQ